MMDTAGPIILGTLMVLAASIGITYALTENKFHIEAVAHGYAHYDLNRDWHWNNEGQKP